MKTNSNPFVHASETPWEYASEGMTRQIMGYGSPLMLVKVRFQTGAVGATHSHPHTQGSYVVSGKFEVTIAGEKRILEAGDGFYVAPEVAHGCICLEEGILIDTFSPMRQDFLS
jgi:quercetin dioxygenase-like cupin family protein